MVVRPQTGLGLVVEVELLIGGFDKPPFSNEAFILAVHEAVTTPINSAVKPWKSNRVDVLLQVQHGSFLPALTRKHPFIVDLTIWVLKKSITDKGVHAPQHLAFSPLILFQEFLTFRRGIVDVSPLAKLGARQAEPDLFGSSLSTELLQTLPSSWLVQIEARVEIDSPRLKTLGVASFGEPAVWRACHFPDTITSIKTKLNGAGSHHH
jgi:hypothetical protein